MDSRQMRKIFYSPYCNFIYCVTVVSGYNYSNLFKVERKPQSGKYMNVTTMMKNAHLSYFCFFILVLGVFWVFCLMCFHRSSWKSPMTRLKAPELSPTGSLLIGTGLEASPNRLLIGLTCVWSIHASQPL